MKISKKNPKHVAIVMDGNGTWSIKNNLQKKEGHKKGVKTAKKIVSSAIDIGIENITLFALSSENLNRSTLELKNLFDIFFYSFSEESEYLENNNIKIKFIGDLQKLPKKIKEQALSLEKKTRNNKKINLFIALNYCGKQDIKQAIKKLLKDGQKNKSFEDFLYSKDLPDVDLLIRTGGYKRLSNFLLWQISYSELYFTNILWPNFSKKNFYNAIDWYKNINRKFGKN